MIGFQGFSDRRNEDCRRHYRIMRRELRMPEGTLFLVVNALDSWGDGGEHLVGDGACGGRHLLQEVGIAKDDHRIALLTRDVCDIQKAHIHTDTSNDGCGMVSHKNGAVAIAQAARESVGITDGKDCDARIALGHPTAVVAHRVATGDFLDL